MRAMESTRGENSSMISSLQDQTTEMIQHNPGISMMVVFGVGVGVGALISEAFIRGAAAMTPSETTFERLGRQVCDTLGIRM